MKKTDIEKMHIKDAEKVIQWLKEHIANSSGKEVEKTKKIIPKKVLEHIRKLFDRSEKQYEFVLNFKLPVTSSIYICDQKGSPDDIWPTEGETDVAIDKAIASLKESARFKRLTATVIKAEAEFYEALSAASKKYGVPESVIEAAAGI